MTRTSNIATQISVRFWEWEAIKNLPVGPKLLWLGLYTSGAGRLSVPGLFFGSITSMAEAVHMPVDETLVYLEQLLKADLVEYDRERRVLRFTKLPDACEAPYNGNNIRGWWRKFQCVPECQVRDAHVATLWWMIETSAKERGKPVSNDHREAWSETFGTVQIPAPRKRGVRSLIDHDTGTHSQPSLFGFMAQGTVPGVSTEPETYPSSPASDSPNDLATPETISKRFAHTRVQDQDRGPETVTGSGSDSYPDPDPQITSRANQRRDGFIPYDGPVPAEVWASENRPTCGTIAPPPLRLVPLPVDERSARRAEIVRTIGPKHAMAFQRVKKAIGSTAFGPSVVDDHAELRQLLEEIPLDDAMERCEHVLAVREAEAVRTNSMQYFGVGMWRRHNFMNALTREVADVDGSRSAPARSADVFSVADDAIEKFFASSKELKP